MKKKNLTGYVRARTHDGQPVRGVYMRYGRFVAGYMLDGKWTMEVMKATDIDSARLERTEIVRHHNGYLTPEWRQTREPKMKSVDQIYTDARRLAQQISLARSKVDSGTGKLLAEAEGLMGKTAELTYNAWRKTRL